MIGMVTPPIGLNLFVMSRIGGVGVMEIFRAGIPFMAALVVALALVTYVPWITTALPIWLMR